MGVGPPGTISATLSRWSISYRCSGWRCHAAGRVANSGAIPCRQSPGMKGKPVAGRAPGMRAKGVLVTGIGRSRVKGVNWEGARLVSQGLRGRFGAYGGGEALGG